MRGQYFSFDAIIGAVIFIMAIGLLLNYWYGVRAASQSQARHLGDEALAMSDTLLSDGVPPNWYVDIRIAKTPGLLTGTTLNATKIANFKTLTQDPASYPRLKELFGLSGEYYVTIMPYDRNGYPDTAYSTEIGASPITSGAVEIGHVTRATVFLRPSGGGASIGELARLDVYVWSNKTVG